MKTMNIGDVTDELVNNTDIFIEGKAVPDTATLIAVAVVGVIVCFLGLKLVKILAAIAGLVFGAALGAAACTALNLEGVVSVIVVIAAAVIVAALSFGLYRFGIFVVVLSYVFGVCVVLLKPQGVLLIVACSVIALLFAVLAAVFLEPVVIIATGISGGMHAGICIAALAGLGAGGIIGYLAGAALSIGGVAVQFMMHSRKIGKTEVVHAEKYKEEVSMESEVEKARKILEEDEEDED